jgi:stage II sporulation protein AA (anti-sigma F factor antagonist)
MMISDVEPDGPLLRVRIAGELDGEGAQAIRPLLERLAADPTGDVVLDLEKVTFLDGAGLGAIAYLFKRLMARERRLKVVGASGQPLTLLDGLGLRGPLGLPTVPGTGWRRSGLSHRIRAPVNEPARGQVA